MINQLGVGLAPEPGGRCVSPSSTQTSSGGGNLMGSSGGGVLSGKQESMADIDNASAYASSFLSSLGGPRPRRFSASFSPAVSLPSNCE